MTNEAIEFAEIDKTAYLTLQEATEHKNQVDKKFAKTTSGLMTPNGTRKNGFGQLLEDQLILRKLNELDQTVPSEDSQSSAASNGDIGPPKFLPPANLLPS